MGLKVHSNKDLYTIQQIEADLYALYEFCQQINLTQDDIEEICKPLTVYREKFWRKVRKYATILFLVFVLYALYQFEFFSWHMSALGRLTMIQTLPIYNWKNLKNEKCLISNKYYENVDGRKIDCTFCEAIHKFPVEIDPSFDVINSKYVKLNMPLILIGKIANYSTNNSRNINNFVNYLESDVYTLSYPCKLSSNIISDEENVRDILTKTLEFDEYFLHFQNCDFGAVKQFRRFFPKPNILNELSPVQYSWLLLSKNYNVQKFKPVYLKDKIAYITQIFGENLFRLKPVKECEIDCPFLDVTLTMGESLIITSMWDLDYKPGNSENMAVLLEMH